MAPLSGSTAPKAADIVPLRTANASAERIAGLSMDFMAADSGRGGGTQKLIAAIRSNLRTPSTTVGCMKNGEVISPL